MPVPKTPNLDIAVIFAAVSERNSAGVIQWADEAKGIPKMSPTISFETRLHF